MFTLSVKRQYPSVNLFLMCKGRWSRGKGDLEHRAFYVCFRIAACFEALFEFHKTLCSLTPIAQARMYSHVTKFGGGGGGGGGVLNC